MAYQNVVVQGIEFQNLLVTNSIMYEPSIGETFAIETKPEPEPVYLDFEDAEPLSPEENKEAVKKQRSYFGAFVHQLSSWLNHRTVTSCPSSPDDVEATELWEEWEWILSEAEKFVCRRSVEEANEIQNELEKLRKNANLLKSRPGFLNAARQAIDMVPLSEEERILLSTMVLDSNKRSKIIADVVSFYSDDWLHFIEHLFFTGQENSAKLLKAYRDSYPDQTYQKGVLGGLKEAGWQASHGPGTVGLTHYILGDIIWAFWKMLVSSIRYTLDRELEAGELNLLAEKLYECQDYLLELWISTVKNCEFGAAREGDLPKKWALEAEEERKRMVAIKQSGVNARYEYKPVVVLDSERKQLGELKKFLEMSLHFHVNTGVKTGHK